MKLFQEMQRRGAKPDQVTFESILRATATIAALELGKQVQTHTFKTGFVKNVFAGSALIDMYSKCGSIESALHMFKKMPERNLISWNAMLAGFSQNGYGRETLQLYEEMLRSNMKLD